MTELNTNSKTGYENYKGIKSYQSRVDWLKSFKFCFNGPRGDVDYYHLKCFFSAYPPQEYDPYNSRNAKKRDDEMRAFTKMNVATDLRTISQLTPLRALVSQVIDHSPREDLIDILLYLSGGLNISTVRSGGRNLYDLQFNMYNPFG